MLKIPIKLPYSLSENGRNQNIRNRLLLLSKSEVKFPVEQLKIDLTKKCRKEPIDCIFWKAQSERDELWLSEYDKVELMAAFLCKNESRLPDNFILNMTHVLNDWFWHIDGVEQKVEHGRRLLRNIEQMLQDSAIHRIRAKLAFRECLFVLLEDKSILLDLIKVTPRYLKCDYIQATLHRSMFANKFPNKVKGNGEAKFLDGVIKSLRGDKRFKIRKYSYWRIYRYYNRVSNGIKIYKIICCEDFLSWLCSRFGISATMKDLIINNPRKFSDLTLSIMVENQLIPDAATYTKIIEPHIKKVKKATPGLRACQPIVEAMLDLPSAIPDFFEKYDLWQDVDDYDYGRIANSPSEEPKHHLGVLIGY